MTAALPWIVAAVVALLWCLFVLRPAIASDEAKRAASDDAPADPKSMDPASAAAKRRETLLQLVGLVVAGTVWFVAGRPGLAVAVIAPWTAVVLLMRRRREERERLDNEGSALDAISAASRALRAGIPVPGIFSILAAEARGVAGACFREIVRRESLGEDLDSAIRRVLIASPVTALRAFGLALLVHGSAGGNLADSTDRLARSLLERSRVRRRTRTITSYGRNAGMMLSVMPIIVLFVLSTAVEGYRDFVFNRPEGNMMLAISAGLVMIGILSMQRITRIERKTEGIVR